VAVTVVSPQFDTQAVYSVDTVQRVIVGEAANPFIGNAVLWALLFALDRSPDLFWQRVISLAYRF
jgi:hypothetical protein